MKVPGSKIVPCQGVLGSNHSLTFGLFTQVSGSGLLGPLVDIRWYFQISMFEIMRFNCICDGPHSAVISTSYSRARSPGFDTRSSHILSFLRPLNQEGHLSVTGKS